MSAQAADWVAAGLFFLGLYLAACLGCALADHDFGLQSRTRIEYWLRRSWGYRLARWLFKDVQP